MAHLKLTNGHLTRTTTGHLAVCSCDPPACTIGYNRFTGDLSWTSNVNGSDPIASVTLDGVPVAFNGSQNIGTLPIPKSTYTLDVTNDCGAAVQCVYTAPCEQIYSAIEITVSGLPATFTVTGTNGGYRTITGLDSANGTHTLPITTYLLGGGALFANVTVGGWNYEVQNSAIAPVQTASGNIRIDSSILRAVKTGGHPIITSSQEFDFGITCPSHSFVGDWGLGNMGAGTVPQILIPSVNVSSVFV